LPNVALKVAFVRLPLARADHTSATPGCAPWLRARVHVSPPPETVAV
jgi:hypothetical protein